MRTIKTYSELSMLKTFDERFDYLKIGGRVGEDTFGSKRYLNQMLYNSDAWKEVRNSVIIRDQGCDLGVPGFDIGGMIYVHHIEPITIDDILHRHPNVLDQDNLICVSRRTHEAIHYGDKRLLIETRYTERKPNDTRLW